MIKEWKKQTDIPVFAGSNESRELNDYRIKTFNQFIPRCSTSGFRENFENLRFL